MAKPPSGYHSLFAEIPDQLWESLSNEAETRNTPVANVLTEVLAKRYGVRMDDLPRKRHSGRPPKRAQPCAQGAAT